MDDLKWVRRDMDLYSLCNEHSYIVSVKNTGILDEDFFRYANYFFDAAESVVHYLCEESNDTSKLDTWYFPLVYLYRQSLELILKACLFKLVTDRTKRLEMLGQIRHDVRQAFDMIIDLIGLNVVESENASWLMEFLSDISAVDRESDVFRYPFGNKVKTLFQGQTHISLVDMHDNMAIAYQIIESVYHYGMITKDNLLSYEPKLMVVGGNYYQQSVIGSSYNGITFDLYCSAYTKVGDFLKERLILKAKHNLFLPMSYMYRNAIELALKRLIIEDSHIDVSKRITVAKRKGHSLLGLWNSIKDEVKKAASAPEDDTTMSDAQQYLHAFHDFDCHSDLFRYPCDKRLNSYFTEGILLDVNNISCCFKELNAFLNGVDIMMSSIKDYEADMRHEMERNWC